MEIERYLQIMNVPPQWNEWRMLPDEEYLQALIRSYETGMENASEHDRNGMFHWWLKKDPNEEQLVNLAKLTLLDPDQLMANDVREHIRRASSYSKNVEDVLNNAI
jgi:hypothetical protein